MSRRGVRDARTAGVQMPRRERSHPRWHTLVWRNWGGVEGRGAAPSIAHGMCSRASLERHMPSEYTHWTRPWSARRSRRLWRPERLTGPRAQVRGMARDPDQHPVVLRLSSVRPGQLAGIARHARRTCGDLAHVDGERSHLNAILHGGEQWDTELREEIKAAAKENQAEEVAALRAAGRTGTAANREAEGPSDPWNACSRGPLREFILTANRTHFLDGDGAIDPAKVDAFVDRSTAFFTEHFPGQLRHLRLDLDEEAPHLHGVLATWTEITSARRGTQRRLQPSSQPLLKDYERAQDAAGAWFAEIGLVRGEARARDRRKARANGEAMPQGREHIPPSEWRADIVRDTGANWAAAEAARREAADKEEIARRERRMAEEERRKAAADRAAAERSAQAAEQSRAEAAREHGAALSARAEAKATATSTQELQEILTESRRQLAIERQAVAKARAEADAERKAAREERLTAEAVRVEMDVAKAAAEAERRMLEAVCTCIDGLITGVMRYVRAGDAPGSKAKITWGPERPEDQSEREAIVKKAKPGVGRVMTLIGRLVHHVDGGDTSPQETGLENAKKDENGGAQSPRSTGARATDARRPARQRMPNADRGWER